jgi:hypothetical protein
MWSLVESRAARKRGKTRVRPARQLPRRAPIYPSDIYPFIDKVQVWLRQPLAPAKRRWLDSRCDLHVLDQPAEWDPSFRQRLQIRQPPPEVLRWLDTLGDVKFNAVEVALDWTFDSAIELRSAHKFFRQHVVKRWHNKKHGITYYEASRYPEREGARNVPTDYADKYCRISGEVDCLHVEWRINGTAAMKRAGITLAELPAFDHYAFWKQRLLMATVDISKLGRQSANRTQQTRRLGKVSKRSWPRFDLHLSTGNIMVQRLEDQSTQGIIDAYATKYPSSVWLVRFDTDHLLPAGLIATCPPSVTFTSGSTVSTCRPDLRMTRSACS